MEVFRSVGVPCRALSRTQIIGADSFVADLSEIERLVQACEGVSCIFHCAGHAHAFATLSHNEDVLYWKVNFEGTQNLLEAAKRAGVRRFINLSSVKAMADPGARCVDEAWPGDPETAYGKSKRAAEQAVLAIGQQSNMHVVNLRLSMVYGPGGRGNLERMACLVRRGWFPPLPETGNHRSLVFIDDVISAMHLVAEDPKADGRTYIVTSSEAPSGRELFEALRRAYKMPSCGWSVPNSVLRMAATVGDSIEALARRRMPFDSGVLNRLLDSAWYSPTLIERELGWRARVSLEQGLAELVGK